jgi:hypothetical protein
MFDWYLIAQLEVRAMFLLALHLGATVSSLWSGAPHLSAYDAWVE